MQDAPRTIEMIGAFHANGFEIAIDDFGTGYSSLAYLQRFRVKQLKIDRFFTNGLDANGPEGSAIVSAIIALAHSLEMDVVAEGVETTSQLDKLKGLLCDQMQGFLLGRPLTAEAFGALLHEHTGAAPT
jgi:EAL domain-containing protein (putative c-di-GMP-specific phosphodiesterase class I)